MALTAVRAAPSTTWRPRPHDVESGGLRTTHLGYRMTASFTCRTELDAAPEGAFELSRSIDAHLGSMADTGERAVGGVTSGLIGLGETVTWRARHFGVMWTMTSRITALDEPRTFTDEQVRGPFADFRHVHVFEPLERPDGRDGTLMLDHIAFAAPLGPLGRIAERVALTRHLRRLIESRNAWLARALRQAQ